MEDIFILPKPYPDELWYSLFARYHRHSGNVLQSNSWKDLFGNENVKVSPVGISDAGIQRYIQLHGNTHGDSVECYLKYTLLPFWFRCYSQEEKLRFAECINDKTKIKYNYHVRSISTRWQTKNTYLKYCPICMRNDTKLYGESYWHRTHQLWLLDKCPIHGCKLLNSTVFTSANNTKLFCADESTCPDDTLYYQASPFDPFIPYAITALCAEFSFCAEKDIVALQNAVLLADYGQATEENLHKKQIKFSTFSLAQELYETYGREVTQKIATGGALVTDEKMRSVLRTIFRSTSNVVEAAILLAAFFQIPPEKVFGPIRGPSAEASNANAALLLLYKGESEYHVQYHVLWYVWRFAPVLTGKIAEYLNDDIHEIAKTLNVTVDTIDCTENIVHLMIECSPQHHIAQIVKIIKAETSRHLFARYPNMASNLYGSGFVWSQSYFIATPSEDVAQRINQYINYQKKFIERFTTCETQPEKSTENAVTDET